MAMDRGETEIEAEYETKRAEILLREVVQLDTILSTYSLLQLVDYIIEANSSSDSSLKLPTGRYENRQGSLLAVKQGVLDIYRAAASWS